MKVAICEDEPVFAQELKNHITTILETKGDSLITQIFPNEEAVRMLCPQATDFDVIFMDINLGGNQDGIALCRELRSFAPKVPIIFVTSLENRAIDGYDVDAFSFIVKKNYTEKLPFVLDKLWKELYYTSTLSVTEKNNITVVSVNDILWVESEGRNTLIHTADRDYTDIRSIQHFAPLLDEDDFVECFKSVYVNIAKIKSINADTITLANDSTIPVSRRNRKTVMQAVMKKVRER